MALPSLAAFDAVTEKTSPLVTELDPSARPAPVVTEFQFQVCVCAALLIVFVPVATVRPDRDAPPPPPKFVQLPPLFFHQIDLVTRVGAGAVRLGHCAQRQHGYKTGQEQERERADRFAAELAQLREQLRNQTGSQP